MVLIIALLGLITKTKMQAFPKDLNKFIAATEKYTYFDRNGVRLNVTYENQWNVNDQIQLHAVPELLLKAFVFSEDKRYFEHSGIDWLARLNASKQNVLAGDVIRGASTITEQVVRMIHPRPRTVWSRWLEGFEAMTLESQFSKLEILEFYINHVPYKARRRGIVQAADYYYDRDLETLNEKELLTLAVLIRSPQWLDPVKRSEKLNQSINNLLGRMEQADLLHKDPNIINKQKLALLTPGKTYYTQNFVDYVSQQDETWQTGSRNVYTTLDLELQRKVQGMLDNRLDNLSRHHVQNGAVLIVDHETNEILSWVVGYSNHKDKAFNKINSVITRRQPGSALKPLLYANTFMHGWTAATMLDDVPLQESVGLGMHTYNNYSREHYGLISAREALGNSLNIPAVKAVQYITPNVFLGFLYDLGIKSLSGHPNVYGDGLALGNGEISLYELVQAYTVMARMGDFKPLSFIDGDHIGNGNRTVISEEVASLIGDILSDPGAREKEFGWGSILNFPYQTAIKTGTSSDYRDAWSIGYNDKYTVGVWIGNLDYSEMHEVTGSSGPALVLRSIFNELNKNREVRPLYLSNKLVRKRICITTGLEADEHCEAKDEWFIPGTLTSLKAETEKKNIRIKKPGNGLMMAMDPRIQDDHEYFEFKLTEINNVENIRWYVNGEKVGETANNIFHWKLHRGKFVAYAEVLVKGENMPIITENVSYKVN
ncbi:MAG: penicillin-binding protein [Proteobacteria bacterium]|nr:penicillin-binding protein [Pseudomonadota bacterium]NOG59495.1 penicillin-binding protein [Pseudomonadota bacterium]